jgi:hypothetical protein
VPLVGDTDYRSTELPFPFVNTSALIMNLNMNSSLR